jgi:peptidoglycan hydrolase-like protein with peptidoglycan-binding domain
VIALTPDPIGLLGLLWLLFKGQRESGGAAPAAAPRVTPGGGVPELTSTPEWPQAVPSGLPAFPGSGWEYDEPPPKAVQQRAGQLVSSLWSKGAGASKIELTGGRWIAFRAEKVRSGKNGVVAYRVKRKLKPAGSTAATPSPAAPAAVPVSTSGRVVSVTAGRTYAIVLRVDKAPPGVDAGALASMLAGAGATKIQVEVGPPILARYTTKYRSNAQFELGRPITAKFGATEISLTFLSISEVPQQATAPAQVPPGVLVSTTPLLTAPSAATSPIASLPDLKMGMGLQPAAPVAEVKIVQQRLRVSPIDGRFGSGTRDAVIAFQVRTGLAPNLPIAQLRARGFGAVKRATWEKLFSVQA